MLPQPLIAVHDVEASSRWYQSVLGFESAHGGGEYERLTFKDKMVLQLHHWDAHDHPQLGDAKSKPYGNMRPAHCSAMPSARFCGSHKAQAMRRWRSPMRNSMK